jgi:hypothetical protein
MLTDWDQLRHTTVTAQVTFLSAEADTGITLARVALQSNDRERMSRNARSARKAYETLTSHIADLPPKTPGLDDIRKKLESLRQMLDLLGKRR